MTTIASAQTAEQFMINPATTMGAVKLGVSNLDKMVRFYTDQIGLALLDQSKDAATLGVDETPLLHLEQRFGQQHPGATGLYHFALLLPSRADLGRWLHHLAESGYTLQGASDHFVSEALYLSDPEGNGIEIYRDRPRSEWTHLPDGSLNIGTVRLDLQALLADAAPPPFAGLPTGTMMGHVHLQVDNVSKAATFYQEILGFDVMMMIGSAGFLGAGGYHHHLGMNVWHSQGATPPPAGSLGLIDYEIILPSQPAYDDLLEHLAQMNQPIQNENGRSILQDPAGNRLALLLRQ